MRVQVGTCDDEERVLFGRLDNEPVVGTGLGLGDELAVSYEKAVEHRKAAEFGKQYGMVAFHRSSAERKIGRFPTRWPTR